MGFEVPWWFKVAAGLMGLFVLMMPVLMVRAWRARKRVISYVASRGWTYRDRDRALGKLPNDDILLVVLRGVPAFVWHDHGGEPVASVEGVS